MDITKFKQKRNIIIALTGKKKCSLCKKLKKVEEFYKNASMVNGYASQCIECVKTDKEATNRRNRKWRLNNLEKSRACTRNWQKKNHKRHMETVKKNKRKQYATVKGKLRIRMSSIIRNSLKSGKNGNHWESLVGYTLDELKTHLENQFIDGMSWDNYGVFGWHIDHIIPKASFNYSSYEDENFKKCWELSNLQPLWAKDNWRKSKKLMNEN